MNILRRKLLKRSGLLALGPITYSNPTQNQENRDLSCSHLPRAQNEVVSLVYDPEAEVGLWYEV